MRCVFLLLLMALSAISGDAQASVCLDLTNSANQCSIRNGRIDLNFCGITDDDVAAGYLDACFDAVGRQNILELVFLDNRLTFLPPGIFDTLTELTYLSLWGNDLSSLPSGIFDSLTELVYLSFGDNDLTTLPSGVFDSLTKLILLNFPGNNLSSLDSGVFDSLAELDQLILNGNDLITLPGDIFDSLTELTSLDIGDNDISTLPSGIFDSLTELTYLYLGYNDITSLPSGVFDSLTELRWLFLYNNDLQTLPSGIFDPLTELTNLYLSNNGLTTLASGALDSLGELRNLYLTGNDLTTLPSGIFDSLAELVWLFLDDNALTTLPRGIFESLTELNVLRLEGNPDLECLPPVPSADTWDVTVDDTVGAECGCELQDGSNPCGEDETCTPGEAGYTCGRTCSNGIEGFDANGVVCCPLSCGGCAGAGCGSMPGGASQCCGGTIKASGVYCEDSGTAPCIIGSAPPAGTCSNGIEGIDANGVVCCPLSCGRCAGKGCASLPGGSSECCGGGIKSSGILCSESGTAPCVIG